jgi:hypothetical protein
VPLVPIGLHQINVVSIQFAAASIAENPLGDMIGHSSPSISNTRNGGASGYKTAQTTREQSTLFFTEMRHYDHGARRTEYIGGVGHLESQGWNITIQYGSQR